MFASRPPARLTLPAALILLGAVSGLFAAPTPEPAPALTLERIMGHPDWISRSPESPYWSEDGRTIFFSRKRAGSELRDLFRADVETGVVAQVADRDRAEAGAPGGDWNTDFTARVFERAGDIYLRHGLGGGGSSALRQLTRTAEAEEAPVFLVGDRRIAFRRGEGAWFVRDLDSGLESLAAELRVGKDPALAPPADDYLARQQERLLDIVRLRRERKQAAEARAREERSQDPSRVAPPFYLGEDVTITESWLAPSGAHLLVALRPKGHEEGKRDKMPDFVTASSYVETRDLRPQVGAPAPETPRIVLLDLVAGTQSEIPLDALPGIADDPLRALRDKADAARKAREAARAPVTADRAAAATPEVAGPKTAGRKRAAIEAPKPAPEPEAKPNPRVVAVDAARWSDDGSRLVIDVYSVDNKDRWLAAIDVGEKRLLPLERISDAAWINWDFREWGFLPAGDAIWFLSEESGWSHLYLRSLVAPKTAKRALTEGRFVVQDPRLSRDGRRFVVAANREHWGSFETYGVDVEKGGLERLTGFGGLAEATPSPDGRRLALLVSTITAPPELYLQDAEPGAAPRRLTETIEEDFAAVRWSVPEVIGIPSSHGVAPIASRVYTPQTGDGAAPPPDKRPAVVFVHGAGYLQNAHLGWSSYFREFMFHTYLVRAGYVVLDMDFRASAGHGRDWRTAIYRRMGEPELEDLEDGVRWLVENRGVDPARVGVYGGSYGGFLTFMALFNKPDLFACGAALRPVADWAHYNHPYTSNILNTPEIDPEAYERSSPIEFAQGLRKPLLILHGMVDDNVVFQDSVRLVQRLIELRKSEWFETAIYPVEPHAFKEPSSWLDEYTRIWLLMERNLQRR